MCRTKMPRESRHPWERKTKDTFLSTSQRKTSSTSNSKHADGVEERLLAAPAASERLIKLIDGEHIRAGTGLSP